MTKDELLRALRTMLLIRHLEQQLVDYYLKNKVMSFVHFYVGQEAVAAGVCDSLSPEDKAFGNHRSHGHYLAKGGNPVAMVGELLGRKGGCCHGKGGSMHMIDRKVNFIGSTPILGSVVPIATGSALSSKLMGKPEVTVAFFGDGASEEGLVYESVNFAALFKLPVIYVVENNLYSVISKLRDRRSEGYDSKKIASGLGATYIRADGNDYVDVYKKATEARALALSGSPVVLECIVFRHMAHSAPIFDDKIGHREQDILEERLKQDPILKVRGLLVDGKLATPEELDAIDKEVLEKCRATIAEAVALPYPTVDDLHTEVYAS